MNNLNNLIINLKKESNNVVFVIAKKTNLNLKILKFLYKKKFIESFCANNLNNTIKIYFNFSTFKNLNFKFSKLISTPGNKIYSNYKGLNKYTNGSIISTNKGLYNIADLKNKKFKSGGEVFFYLK